MSEGYCPMQKRLKGLTSGYAKCLVSAKKHSKINFYKLENYFDKSRLSLQDSDFLEDVESDVISFADGRKEKRVLVFPPVNNYRRFLIHKLVDEQFPTLTTFSIGGGEARRPVICFRTDYIQPQITKPKISDEATSDRVPKSPDTCPVQPKRERRSYTMPSITIYRPPAARRLEDQNTANQEREPINDSINGKHDCKCSSEIDESSHMTKKTSPSGISMFRNAISSIRTQNQTPKCKTVESVKKSESTDKSNQVRLRRPDMKVYVPKARRMLIEQQKPLKEESLVQNEVDSAKNSEESKKSAVQNEVNSLKSSEQSKMSVVQTEVNGLKNSEQPKKTRETSERVDSNKIQCESSSVCTKNPDNRTIKIDARTVYHVSPSSLWIEAQNEVEVDLKKMSSPIPVEISGSNGSDSNASKSSVLKICDKKAQKPDSPQLNPDECDWETMFDDSGECLDPSLMEQLSSAVGAVTIEKPKSNYDTFKTKTLDLVGDEFPHVIEIYNFPPEFRHQDLVIVFSQFKNAGFEIKWVDDTHALGIFSNSQIVSEVLALRHPFVKTRLLKDGTMLSKAKARRFSEQLLPYKPRPDTCPALARRLVTGALGVRLRTSREEREAERKILSEAREKKRLEAKQREEAWEGTFH